MFPRTLGRMPAEWDPHEACWLAYPHLREEWSDAFEGAQKEFVALCRAIEGERIELLVPTPTIAAKLEDELDGKPVRTHVTTYGDCWTRDTAPIFVHAEHGLRAVCFRFNGWGEKYDMPGDRDVAGFIAARTGVPGESLPWVMEGGALEVDGEGTVLTTRQCLLHENRNPGRSQADLEQLLRAAIGVSEVLWLNDGLRNDHTDGHIDTLARFVAPGVVVCMEPRGDDPNAGVLQDIARELARFKDARGRRLEVVRIPSPGLLLDGASDPMPGSYCNFYVSNRSVVVPTYGSAWDDEAVERIAALFPSRKTVGVSARAILHGGGAFHCMTQQQPESR